MEPEAMTRSRLAAIAVSLVLAPVGQSMTDFQLGSPKVIEGNGGARTVDVLVLLSQPATVTTTINFTTRDRTAGPVAATAGIDYVATKGTLIFEKGDAAKRITVSVIGETLIENDEVFDVVVGDPSTTSTECSRASTPGGTAISCTSPVTIVNDDYPTNGGTRGGGPGSSTPSGPIARAGFGVYEVRFTYTGHTGSLVGAPDCPVRKTAGRTVMEGIVSGNEKVASDDDIEYSGTLQFDQDLDLCEVHRVGGEDRLCGITAIGSGPMQVDLSVYEGNRGGYVKAEAAKGRWLMNLFGSCERQLITEEHAMYPNDSKANVFNGEELPLRSGPLRVGRYARPPDPKTPNITMVFEVLRKIQ